MEKREKKARFDNLMEVSAFCTQVSLILQAGIGLDEGLFLMAEDEVNETKREKLIEMANEVEMGNPLYQSLELAGTFPKYMLYMFRIGEESGSLEEIAESLADYYKNEYNIKRTIKNALTYPIIMVFMMLVILYILMTRVMPVFEGVFRQLGTELSPVTRKAVAFGGYFSGGLIVLIVFCVVMGLIGYFLIKERRRDDLLNVFRNKLLRRSKILFYSDVSRFTSVTAMMLKSGMSISETIALAKTVVGASMAGEKIEACEKEFDETANFTGALKNTGFFTGFHQQMLSVGERTGRMDSVLKDISDRYYDDVENRIQNAVAKFEPTIIAVLSVAVGLVLLAVMLPLIGMLASMG